MSNRLIDLQHITKIYDDNTVLDDLNLYIRENEFLTLLGPSGCGNRPDVERLRFFAASAVLKSRIMAAFYSTARTSQTCRPTNVS